MRRVSRSQVTHVPISNCSCSMCAMTVSKLMSTCGNYSCASGGDGRCASNGGFLNGRARRLGPFSTAGSRRLRLQSDRRQKSNNAGWLNMKVKCRAFSCAGCSLTKISWALGRSANCEGNGTSAVMHHGYSVLAELHSLQMTLDALRPSQTS